MPALPILTFQLCILVILSLISLPAEAQKSWHVQFPGIGTFSSPRIADLNKDGIGDIILGAGKEEFQSSDSAVIALDGNTGELLWNVSGTDQVFGSAALKDISGDGIAEVFINGRSAELMAINGATGEEIWRFEKPKSEKNEWFNFYNPQFIPDQNADGTEDILISNGGDVLAEPYDPYRPVGHLVILDSKTGEVISKASMPDGKEIYMSVVYQAGLPDTVKSIIYGTGGETLGGSLYLTSIQEVMTGDLSHSIKLDSSSDKGYISPPSWIDLTGDGVLDIAAIAVEGKLVTFDGTNYRPIWKTKFPNTEAYSSLAIGKFTRDHVPDFFVSIAQGIWPDLNWTRQFMVNGKNGRIEFADSLGFYQTSSPVVLDVNGDGLDEALLSVNYQVYDTLKLKFFYNLLAIINFSGKEVIEMDVSQRGHNVSSTPWIGDLDHNGYVDIVYCHGTNVKQTFVFDGLQVNRIDMKLPLRNKLKWGAYMGSNYDGVYK